VSLDVAHLAVRLHGTKLDTEVLGALDRGGDCRVASGQIISMQSRLPSAPDIRSQLVPYNYQWLVDNRDTVIARFDKWLPG
jgi:hypothetical protein